MRYSPNLVSQAVYNASSNPVPAYAVVVSDVVYTPSSSGCQAGLTCTSYTANMALERAVAIRPADRAGLRHRGPRQGPTHTPTIANNLPVSVPTKHITSALTSMLVVDVVYNFTPFFGRFLGALTMRQTAYFNQRSIVATYITYNIAAAGVPAALSCQGYS